MVAQQDRPVILSGAMLERPVTKRLLGFAMLVGGALGFIAVLAVDLQPGGAGIIGPAQAIALAGCALVAVVGATLIPLGDKPA